MIDFSRYSNPRPSDPRGWGGTYGNSDFSGKLLLTRVRLDRGGYDEYGRYYGRDGYDKYGRYYGTPLWKFENEEFGDEAILHYIRAVDRAEAKRLAREMYPKARFYR